MSEITIQLPRGDAIELLINVISQLSEEHWASTWNTGIECRIWGQLVGDREDYYRKPEYLSFFKAISKALGGWVEWNDAAGCPIFVPLPLWEEHYLDYQERMKQWATKPPTR